MPSEVFDSQPLLLKYTNWLGHQIIYWKYLSLNVTMHLELSLQQLLTNILTKPALDAEFYRYLLRGLGL
jgi:hypothetical protein